MKMLSKHIPGILLILWAFTAFAFAVKKNEKVDKENSAWMDEWYNDIG